MSKADESPRPLTPLQRRFVDEYVKDFVGAHAAIRAGYSEKGAKQAASKLLEDPRIAALVAARSKAVSEAAGLEAMRVIEELKTVAFSDIGEIVDFSGDVVKAKSPKDIPEHARRAIKSVKIRALKDGSGELVEFTLHDKNAAIEKAMRHLGLLADPTTQINNQVQIVKVVYRDE